MEKATGVYNRDLNISQQSRSENWGLSLESMNPFDVYST